MRWLGFVIGVLIILGGVMSFLAPDLLLSLGRSMITPGGLYAIAAVRIVLGVIFVLSAPASRAPRTLRVLGAIVIIAGLITPWFGVTRSLGYEPNGRDLHLRRGEPAEMLRFRLSRETWERRRRHDIDVDGLTPACLRFLGL